MRQRGFSLVEVLVTLGILTLVMVGFLSLFDTSAKISRAQSARADVQENLRYVVSQIVTIGRMPGAGGLPLVVPGSSPWEFAAVEIADNVGVGSNPLPTFGSKQPIAGTDVITFRGAFTGEVFDLNRNNPGEAVGAFSFDEGTNTGSITIPEFRFGAQPPDGDQDPLLQQVYARIFVDREPNGWVPVVLTQLGAGPFALDNGRTRMTIPYAVAILADKDESTRTFTFRARSFRYDAEREYLKLNVGGESAFPTNWAIANMLRMSVINDIIFYVTTDDEGVPTLYQYDRIADINQPVAADIVDLQVALGCDRSRDGAILENTTTDGDEWLFNVAGETLASTGPGGSVPLIGYLGDIRITLVARVPVAERDYVQATLINENGPSNWLTASYAGVPGVNFKYVSLREVIRCRSLGPIL